MKKPELDIRDIDGVRFVNLEVFLYILNRYNEYLLADIKGLFNTVHEVDKSSRSLMNDINFIEGKLREGGKI